MSLDGQYRRERKDRKIKVCEIQSNLGSFYKEKKQSRWSNYFEILLYHFFMTVLNNTVVKKSNLNSTNQIVPSVPILLAQILFFLFFFPLFSPSQRRNAFIFFVLLNPLASIYIIFTESIMTNPLGQEDCCFLYTSKRIVKRRKKSSKRKVNPLGCSWSYYLTP